MLKFDYKEGVNKMDGNGWTGLDETRARDNIREFTDKSIIAENKLLEANLHFFESLRKYWTSPKAVQFGNTYVPKFERLIESYDRNAREIIKSAQIAFNTMAHSQGIIGRDISGFEDSFPFGRFDGNAFVGFFNEKNDRWVSGMNIAVVETQIIPTYIEEFGRAKGLLNEIPTNVALYDPDNNLNSSYALKVNNFINEMSMLYNDMLNSVNQATKEEILILDIAKNQAINALNNQRG